MQVTSTNFGRQVLRDSPQRVTQVFTSAAPVSYSMPKDVRKEDWAPMATLILRASFEATLRVAAANCASRPNLPGSRKVFVTPLGGGAFGNDITWIASALDAALQRCKGLGLDVALVQYQEPLDEPLKSLVQKWHG